MGHKIHVKVPGLPGKYAAAVRSAQAPPPNYPPPLPDHVSAWTEVQALSGRLGDAHALLGEVEDRLSSLLSPIAPAGEAGKAEAIPTVSTLVQELRERVATVETLCARLARLRDRIEL